MVQEDGRALRSPTAAPSCATSPTGWRSTGASTRCSARTAPRRSGCQGRQVRQPRPAAVPPRAAQPRPAYREAFLDLAARVHGRARPPRVREAQPAAGDRRVHGRQGRPRRAPSPRPTTSGREDRQGAADHAARRARGPRSTGPPTTSTPKRAAASSTSPTSASTHCPSRRSTRAAGSPGWSVSDARSD